MEVIGPFVSVELVQKQSVAWQEWFQWWQKEKVNSADKCKVKSTSFHDIFNGSDEWVGNPKKDSKVFGLNYRLKQEIPALFSQIENTRYEMYLGEDNDYV